MGIIETSRTSPANAERLAQSIEEIQHGQTVERALADECSPTELVTFTEAVADKVITRDLFGDN